MGGYFDYMLKKNFLNLTVDEEQNYIFINLADQKSVKILPGTLRAIAFDGIDLDVGNYLLSEKKKEVE